MHFFRLNYFVYNCASGEAEHVLYKLDSGAHEGSARRGIATVVRFQETSPWTSTGRIALRALIYLGRDVCSRAFLVWRVSLNPVNVFASSLALGRFTV